MIEILTQVGPKWSKRVRNWPKLPQIFKVIFLPVTYAFFGHMASSLNLGSFNADTKWPKMVKKGPKWSIIGPKFKSTFSHRVIYAFVGHKLYKEAPKTVYGLEPQPWLFYCRHKLTQNSPNWPKMVLNWPKI